MTPSHDRPAASRCSVASGVVELDDVPGSERGGDARGPRPPSSRAGRRSGSGTRPASCRQGAFGVVDRLLRVDDELVRGEVRPDVVDRVAEPRGGDHADDDGDEQAEADRAERRARASPVPGQVSQRQPHDDRRAPGEPGPAVPGRSGRRARPRRTARSGRRRARGTASTCSPSSAAADVACSLAKPIRKNASASRPTPTGPAQRRAAAALAAVPRARRRPAPGRAPRGPDGGQVRRHHGERHRHEDHQPGQLERAHHVVRAGLRARAVRQPGHQAEREPGDRADHVRSRSRWR